MDNPPAAIPGSPNGSQPVNPRYTFEAFVTGVSNRFAHAAALSVAETPARSYNPLFIYGDAGLGKTHLLQAIAHYVSENYPASTVRYVSTETFMNQFVDAIRTNSPAEFKKRYREVDVLLLDDIQFLEGREGLQEELFHTFNALHQSNHQIVLSSDRPPDAIPTLEDRLRSRFKMGLITEINPPDLETRLAILHKKAETEPITPPPDVLEFIATHITNNIRELEGALIRVCAYASLTKEELSVELAERVLADILSDSEPRPDHPRPDPAEDLRDVRLQHRGDPGQEPASTPGHRPPGGHVRVPRADRPELPRHRPGVRRAGPHHGHPRGGEDRGAHEGAPPDLRPGHRADPDDPQRRMTAIATSNAAAPSRWMSCGRRRAAVDHGRVIPRPTSTPCHPGRQLCTDGDDGWNHNPSDQPRCRVVHNPQHLSPLVPRDVIQETKVSTT